VDSRACGCDRRTQRRIAQCIDNFDPEPLVPDEWAIGASRYRFDFVATFERLLNEVDPRATGSAQDRDTHVCLLAVRTQ
jgi:hypothetical protein